MIGIVAHTKRATQTHILMDQVQAAYTNIDDGTLGCDDNHRHVWQPIGITASINHATADQFSSGDNYRPSER